MQVDDILGLLDFWNPHFQTGKANYSHLEPRTYYLDQLWLTMPMRHIMILTGVRRSGKSVLMHQMIGKLIESGVAPKNILYLYLEDALVDRYLVEQEAKGQHREVVGGELLQKLYATYLEKYNPEGKVYVFIDEIQGISGFNRILNNWYEMRHNIKFIISGSHKSLIESETATLLTGRNVRFNIYPLNFREYLGLHGVETKPPASVDETLRDNYHQSHSIIFHLGKYLEEGAFPEIVTTQDETQKRTLGTAYYRDFLDRDVITPHQVRNQRDVQALGVQILTDFTKTHTYRSLAKPFAISPETVKTYLEYFYQAYLFYESPFFSYSIKQTQNIQKERKIYVVDNGLRNYNAIFKNDLGRCAENLVYLELNKKNLVYYWKGKQEVDFVVRTPDPVLFNVTYTDEIKDREISGLVEGMGAFKLKTSTLLTRNTRETRGVDGKKIELIPLWVWLLSKHEDIIE